MLIPLLALALCALAAVSGAVLAQPVLATLGVPSTVFPFVPLVIFAAVLVPPLVMSGDWLWMNETRRSRPPRGPMLARLALMTGVVSFAAPLAPTDRPLGDVFAGARGLTSSWTGKPEVVAQVVPPPAPVPAPVPAAAPILPTPTDAEFPSVSVVIEAQPLKVIETPTAPQLAQAEPGTFFVYEWQDPQGTLHWSNVFEEIPPEGKVLKATVMKPIEPKEPPKWAVAKTPSPVAPTGSSYFNDPRLPSYAEMHWRSQFRQLHARIRDQERKIAAKQRELWEAPVLANRRAMEQELSALKAALEDLQQEDRDLEREASYRAVPREWRN